MGGQGKRLVSARDAPWAPTRLLLALVILGSAFAPIGASTAAQDDCGSGGDAGDRTAPTPVALPFSCSGEVPGGDGDWYAVFVRAGARLDTALAPAVAERMTVCIWPQRDIDPFLDPDAAMACATGTTLAPRVASAVATYTGQWLIQVASSHSSTLGAYALNASASGGPTDDCASGEDAGDAAHALRLVAPLSNCEARLRLGDTSDWFSFVARPGDRIVAQASPDATLSLELCLHAPGRPREPHCTTSTERGVARLETDALRGGVWHIAVQPLAGTGDYDLSIFAKDALERAVTIPTMLAVTCSPNPAKETDIVRCVLVGAADASEVAYQVRWGVTGSEETRYPPSGYVAPGRSAHAWTILPDGAHEARVEIRTREDDLIAAADPRRTLTVPITVARFENSTWAVTGSFGAEGLSAEQRVVIGGEHSTTAQATLTFESGSDLDLRFEDEHGRRVPSAGCAHLAPLAGRESCHVPPRAAYAVVVARLSPFATYVFEYTS